MLNRLHRFMDLTERQKDAVFSVVLGTLLSQLSYSSKKEGAEAVLHNIDAQLNTLEVKSMTPTFCCYCEAAPTHSANLTGQGGYTQLVACTNHSKEFPQYKWEQIKEETK